MATRREFLSIAAGLSGLAAWPAAGRLHERRRSARSGALLQLVADERIAAGGAFTAQLNRHGARPYVIAGDVTQLWYATLQPRWKEQPAAVGGLTEADALFCLESLAWDHAMRVVYRGEHRALSDGTMLHRLAGPRALISRIEPGATRPGGWPAVLARAMLTFAAATRAQDPIASVSFRTAALPDTRPGLAYSWIISPVQRGNQRPQRGGSSQVSRHGGAVTVRS
ncbi:MAG TPA: hypothetical protein VHX52_11895 [Steroidobacteraceae bacterium]|nr:hypothetical protein [Steroidobacteraceae bacterium]